MKFNITFIETVKREFTIVVEAPDEKTIWDNYDDLYHIALTTHESSDTEDDIEICKCWTDAEPLVVLKGKE